LSAVDQILAHEHGLIEIARLRVPAVGDDAKLDPADERVPEADRKRAAADVELAGPSGAMTFAPESSTIRSTSKPSSLKKPLS
jgi:hypothetical protein